MLEWERMNALRGKYHDAEIYMPSTHFVFITSSLNAHNDQMNMLLSKTNSGTSMPNKIWFADCCSNEYVL